MGLGVLARKGVALCAALALGALALLFAAPSASADIEFCPVGEGAGECGSGGDRGLAVDTETGRLYVADEANNRVNVFEVDGDFLFAFGWGVADGANALQTCTTTCLKGIAGEGPGQLDQPTSVAVDNNPGPSRHAIYVADSDTNPDPEPGPDPRNLRVQKFTPSGEFSVEFVWMVGKEVDKSDSGDLCTQAEGSTCGNGEKGFVEGGFASDIFLAVGPAGVLYAVDNIRDFDSPTPNLIKQRLQRFEPSGAPIPPQAILFEEDLVFARGIAVDATGNLWVVADNGLHKYSPTGTPLAGPFPSPAEPRADFGSGLAIDALGNVYAAQDEERDKAGTNPFNVITAFDPAGDVFRRFAYTSVGEGFSNPINGLAAHTSAFGEIFFSQSKGGINYVFQPPPGPVPAPPSLEVSQLGSAKATLEAEVNPEGKAPTTVHFEYLTQEKWEDQGESFAGAAKTTVPLSVPGGEEFNLQLAEAQIGCLNPATEAGAPGNKCLTPATTYRWRVVATNADGEGPGPVEGPPFTTKESPEIGAIWATRVGTDTARLNAEVNPNSIPATGFFEYVDDAAYQKDIGEGGNGFSAALKAPNVDEGQAPLDFGAGEAFVTRQVSIFPLLPGTVYHYRLIADNPLVEPALSDAEELRTFAVPKVDPCPNDASRIGPGAFLPDCRAYEMVSPIDKEGGDVRVLKNGSSEPGVLEQSAVSGDKLAYGSARSFGGAASAPFTSQYIAERIAGKEWRTHPINSPRGRPIIKSLDQFDTEFKVFSADLCEAWQVTLAEPPLAEGALAGFSNLYRRTDELCSEDEKAHYETLAPINDPEEPPNKEFVIEFVEVSADREHAIYIPREQVRLFESVRGEAPRFVCILPGGTPVSGSCTAGSATGAGFAGAQAGRISNDGERIFWSSPGTGEGQIYVRIGGTQTLAVSKEGEEESGTEDSWFWGAARDGSKAIFSTSDPGAGISDLYEFDVGSEDPELIAGGMLGVLGISEDAERIYFVSTKVLSGGEENSNGDKAEAGKENLYLREATGEIEFIATLAEADLERAVAREAFSRHTARVSPDGAHAVFVSVAPLTGYDNKDADNGIPTQQIYRYDAAGDELLCVSCNPSGARPPGRSSIPPWKTPSYAGRVFSNEGSRVYFESPDRLAAGDTNGQVDVYQWEEPGTGGCDEEDATFAPAAEGCVNLISSGQSPQGSSFVEASPSGNDVFFATVASLLPQDIGVFDIYDARIDGGLPIPLPPDPPCEGDTCAAQVPAPEEPTPASSEYVAPPEAAKRRCPKGKRRVTRKGKSRCVPKKGKNKRRRAAR